MTNRERHEQLAAYRRQIAELRQRMRALRASAEPEDVRDYEFGTPSGSVRLSELFGDKRDLILIHNMGIACPNCTLWADGYNGIYPHLVQRAAFAVSSPDPPEVQRQFAQSRGWRFPMVSHAGSSFAADMGYRSEQGGWLPGISVFRLDGGRIRRMSDVPSDIGDDFCALWHLFDLLPEGAADFQAQVQYA